VAEAVGLTSVHVNRTFRDLTQRGLIAQKKGKQIELLDLDALVKLSGSPERIFAKEPDWLVNCCSPTTGA
jgi:hypothetical protein